MESRLPPDPIYVLRGSTSPINTLRFAPDCVSSSGLLASGSSKGVISLWDLKTKRVHTNINEHNEKGILGLDITQDSKLISQGRDGFINMWDLSNACVTCQTKISAPVFGFCKFSILQNDNKVWLATASFTQSQIDILDLHSRNIIHNIKPDDEKGVGMCMCVKLFTCPKTHQPKVVAGYEDGYIRLFDITSGKLESSLQVHTESVMCIDIDELHQKIVTGSADSKLVVSDVSSMNTLKIHHEVELKRAGTSDVKIRNDCKVVCTGGWDGRVRVYSWKTLKALAILNCHSSTVNAIDFSQTLHDSGILMAAGSKDCRISIWSIYND